MHIPHPSRPPEYIGFNPARDSGRDLFAVRDSAALVFTISSRSTADGDHGSRSRVRRTMEYFYDRHTDMLSLTFGDLSGYSSSRQIAGATAHLDTAGSLLAMEISGARAVVDVSGLGTFEQGVIGSQDLARRMMLTESGRYLWAAAIASASLRRLDKAS